MYKGDQISRLYVDLHLFVSDVIIYSEPLLGAYRRFITTSYQYQHCINVGKSDKY